MILNVDFHTVRPLPRPFITDGGGSAAEDEAFTLVEAAIRICRRRCARSRGSSTLDAAAVISTARPFATPAPVAAVGADGAARAAPEPMEATAEHARGRAGAGARGDDAHASGGRAARGRRRRRSPRRRRPRGRSLTHTDDGSRFLLRWRGGGASSRPRRGRRLARRRRGGRGRRPRRASAARSPSRRRFAADDVPRSSVDGAMAAFLGGAAPAAPGDDAARTLETTTTSAGDFEAEAAAGTAMLVEGDLASDESRYDGGDATTATTATTTMTPGRAVRRGRCSRTRPGRSST